MAKRSNASVLKSKGLIPANWNLRELSRGQKSWITKLTQPGGKGKKPGQFRELVKHPEQYRTVKLSKGKSAASGLSHANGRAAVKAKSARITHKGDLRIREASGTRKTVFYANRHNFEQQYNELSKIRLAKNQVWKLRIGDHYSTKQWRSFDEMMAYAEEKTNMDEWHDENVSDHIAFVLTTLDRPTIIKGRRH